MRKFLSARVPNRIGIPLLFIAFLAMVLYYQRKPLPTADPICIDEMTWPVRGVMVIYPYPLCPLGHMRHTAIRPIASIRQGGIDAKRTIRVDGPNREYAGITIDGTQISIADVADEIILFGVDWDQTTMTYTVLAFDKPGYIIYPVTDTSDLDRNCTRYQDGATCEIKAGNDFTACLGEADGMVCVGVYHMYYWEILTDRYPYVRTWVAWFNRP